jgi:hypothetical protein
MRSFTTALVVMAVFVLGQAVIRRLAIFVDEVRLRRENAVQRQQGGRRSGLAEGGTP